ncbi:uncharacterized protein LOC141905851 [Tubulanus polymorphus]|uniref:uncharacterized protein LOC141905851 n=1 Tax=Tubulanus polymorphus TaxID=672921 RepID=UPI003DA5C540
MDTFVGTWDYHHELSDENEKKFMKDLKFDDKLTDKLIDSKTQVVITKVGENLKCRTISMDGEFDQEDIIYFDGNDSSMRLPDGREITGTYAFKDGKMFAENLKIKDLPNVIVKHSVVVKDGWMKETYEIPAENLTTVTNYKKA